MTYHVTIGGNQYTTTEDGKFTLIDDPQEDAA